jgi:hypothetical protein
MPTSSDAVFINVPFDRRYRKLFDALVFAIHDCGFLARSAREQDDGSQVRLAKLYEIIGDCRFGIHDLSRTSLDAEHGLPRFNMPLELRIFLGAKKYGGGKQARKSCLILDREPSRYQICCSDSAGLDIRAHYNDVSHAIAAVRDWLRTNRPSSRIPGAGRMLERYIHFRIELPAIAHLANLEVKELNFLDYRTLVTGWLDENSW